MIRAITLCFLVLHLPGCDAGTPALPGYGQWRVVNYWAIWCTPCRQEIPELNALDAESGLLVLAVNYDGKEGAILRGEAAEMGITFTLLEKDPVAQLGIQRPRVLPTTLLVSPDGEVTDTLVGPQTQRGLLALWHQRQIEHSANAEIQYAGPVGSPE